MGRNQKLWKGFPWLWPSKVGVLLNSQSQVRLLFLILSSQMLSVSLSVFSLSLSIFSQQYLTFSLSLSLFLSLSLSHTHTHNWQQQRPDKRHPEQEKELAASWMSDKPGLTSHFYRQLTVRSLQVSPSLRTSEFPLEQAHLQLNNNMTTQFPNNQRLSTDISLKKMYKLTTAYGKMLDIISYYRSENQNHNEIPLHTCQDG